LTIQTDTGYVLYKTEVITQNLNPAYTPFLLNVAEAGGLAGVINITCTDWDEVP
jgi:hypothetical protein